MGRLRIGLLAPLAIMVMATAAIGDTWTYLDDEQQIQQVAGRLVASGQGVHVVEGADGQYTLINQSHVQGRVPGADPVPLTADEMAGQLADRFGAGRIRLSVEAPYVVGLVLAAPLPPQSQSKVDGFLRKAVRFLHNVESVFSRFCRELRLPVHRPGQPLVLLVFETDRDFNAYAREVTGGAGLAAENMAGFYSPLSNWLAIRIGECQSFQVPLHEAIHQQVYNRGLL